MVSGWVSAVLIVFLTRAIAITKSLKVFFRRLRKCCAKALFVSRYKFDIESFESSEHKAWYIAEVVVLA